MHSRRSFFKKKLHYFSGQVFSQNLRNRLDLSSSSEGPDTEDNNYLGYSLAIGDFTGSGRADLAVGMPRSANLTGKVKSCSKITHRLWAADNHYHILRWCCLLASDCSICTTWQVAKSDHISDIQWPFWMQMETAWTILLLARRSIAAPWINTKRAGCTWSTKMKR